MAGGHRGAEHGRAAADSATGAVHTRTGRSFFPPDTTEQLLAGLRAAVGDAGLWDELDSGCRLLDAELLPWSAKAEDLLRYQYAAVGAAARAVLPAAVSTLEAAAARGLDVADLLARTSSRARNADAFTDAYRRYVWPTDRLAGVQLAPFQLLASQGHVRSDRDHDWHLGIADRLVQAAPGLLRTTRRLRVDTTDPGSVATGVQWWQDLTDAGGKAWSSSPSPTRL